VSTVSRTTRYQVVDSTIRDHIGEAGRVTFNYSTEKPHEVVLGSPGVDPWICGRDTFALRQVGLSDVQCCTTGLWYYITLFNGSRRVTVRVLAAVVQAFLSATERLVPYGAEEIDLDAGIALLLSGGSR
jgi:hypothetical protein